MSAIDPNIVHGKHKPVIFTILLQYIHKYAFPANPCPILYLNDPIKYVWGRDGISPRAADMILVQETQASMARIYIIDFVDGKALRHAPPPPSHPHPQKEV